MLAKAADWTVRLMMIVLLAIMLAAMSFCAAQAAEPGDVFIATAFCVDEGETRSLTDAVETHGDDGYNAVMSDPRSACYDLKLNPAGRVQQVTSTLVERHWLIHHANGDVYEVWTSRDRDGEIAWVWLFLPGS